MIIVDYRVGHSGAQSQVPLCSTKNIAFFAFQAIDVQKMRKVLFLIVLGKRTFASNATIVINAALCGWVG